jgi:hypothetical protein
MRHFRHIPKLVSNGANKLNEGDVLLRNLQAFTQPESQFVGLGLGYNPFPF